jgi:hypothetical protein
LTTDTVQDAVSITSAKWTTPQETAPTETAETTTAGKVVYTTDFPTTTEEIPQDELLLSTDELLMATSVDSSTAGEFSEASTRGNAVYTTHVSTTTDEVKQATSQVPSSTVDHLLPTSLDSSNADEISPNAYEAVIDHLNYTSLPPDCFARIDQRCLFSDDPEKFSCSDNEISKLIAVELLVDFSLEIGGFLNEKVSPEITQSRQ